jgi:hypothetical protein
MRVPATLTIALVAASPLAGQQRFTGRIAAVVESLGVAAAARGLPVDPVIEKAIEGSAKGIPAERVTTALRVVVDQLDTAAASLREGGISGDTIAIAAGEFAISAGLHGRDITELARTGRPAADVTVGLRVAGTLAALGVPPLESVKLVSAELRLGRPPADLLALPGRVETEVAHGATPAQAAAGLTRAAAGQAGGPGGPGAPAGPGGPRHGPPPGKSGPPPPPPHPTHP